jgi:hypothetical protein
VAAVATEEMMQNEVEMVELVSTFDCLIGSIRMLFLDTSLEDLGATVLLGGGALEVEQGALVLSLRIIRVVMVVMQGTPELQAEEEVAVQHRL